MNNQQQNEREIQQKDAQLQQKDQVLQTKDAELQRKDEIFRTKDAELQKAQQQIGHCWTLLVTVSITSLLL